MESLCAAHAARLKADPYVSIVPDRTPVVKVHRSLSLAKRAIGDRYFMDFSSGRTRYLARGGEIYGRSAEGWELLYRVEARTPLDALPWKREES
jgi:hypothetical protein